MISKIKKWWFNIKEINQLINSSLCSFDEEYFRILFKNFPINPYTKVVLSYKDLLSVYNQLKSFNCNHFYLNYLKSQISIFNIL